MTIITSPEITIVDILFVIRLFPLMLTGCITTRSKNFLGMMIAFLYLAVTTVNYLVSDPGLNAVFSTPLVFFTAWYIIKTDSYNRRNRRFKFVKKEK